MSTFWRGPGAYVSFAVLVLAVVIQGTLFGRVTFFGAHPDLVLIVIVCWSLLKDVTSALLLAFLAGLGIDLMAGWPLGSSSLALMPVAFLGSLGRSSIDAQHGLFPVLLVLLATPLHGLVVLLLLQIRGVPVEWLGAVGRVILPAMVLNALLTLPVIRLLRWLTARFEPARATG